MCLDGSLKIVLLRMVDSKDNAGRNSFLSFILSQGAILTHPDKLSVCNNYDFRIFFSKNA